MEITPELANRIINALPYGEERDELMAMLPDRNDQDKERTVTITVRESEASHYAHALRIGSTTAMMCRNHEEVIPSLRRASEQVEEIVPAVFENFLHQSDVEKVCEMFRHETVTIEQVDSWTCSEIVFRREGKNDFKPFLKSNGSTYEMKIMVEALRKIYEKYKAKQ